MNIHDLLSNIETILQEKGLSERKACLDADISPDFIRDMRRNGNFPKVDKLIKLANSLKININFFLDVINPQASIYRPITDNTIIPFKTVYIKGEIQASQWTDTLEWPKSKWIPFPTPISHQYKNNHPFAFMVKGNSINQLYSEGSIIIAVNFSDLGRDPENGECVIILRQDLVTGHYKSALKLVQLKQDGQILLWPHSNNPKPAEPLPLPTPTNRSQNNHSSNDTLPAPEIIIQSLVIGCYCPIKKTFL